MAAALTCTGAEGRDHLTRPSAAVVITDEGTVRGLVSGTARSFLGIPYAAAPVGALRWRSPQPHARWRGIRSATVFGSSCPQPVSLFGRQSSNEDCLFLNVYAPLAVAGGKTGSPVMVWIHGGGLVSGEASDYDPVWLVRRGVLVVTVNYRLGPLGFLAHPSLTAESPEHASGNYGLRDQQLALRWVQHNIGRFGGDPGNVTIFGESAGGLSVHAQIASPAARGLFQKAIIESGGYAGTQPPLATAETAGRAFADKIGCSDQTAACLRKVPVTKLIDEGTLDVTPVIDGKVLTRSMTEAFASGRFNLVPVIEGSNHDEFRLFVAASELTSGPLKAAGYQAAISKRLGVPSATATLIATQYPLSAYSSPSIALATIGTDAAFACRARAAVRALSQYVSSYQYEFNDEAAPQFFPIGPVGFPLGAFHAAELQYLFPLGRSQLTGDHARLSRAMLDAWTTFAKTGDPGPGWPRYSTATDEAESLRPKQPTVETGFAVDHKCAFWETMPAAGG